ncbi:MAG: hypothetical protein GKS06_09545 [Acidobacteria bacterium]|nr:hypothetical protein [Acidobacteriota bacterium]
MRIAVAAIALFAFLPQQGIDSAVLNHAARMDADRATDAGRKVLEVYEWIGIRPGMDVADVFAGTGYNTQLLGLALGNESQIHSVLGFFAATAKENFGLDFKANTEQRIEAADLTNVTIHSTLADLPDMSLDAIVSIRNYHDIGFFGGDAAEALANMHRALRSGGVVGVVEVATDNSGWDANTHRLGREAVISEFTSNGFELVDESDMLANPDDDHSADGFATGRHLSDRYLLKFRKAG